MSLASFRTLVSIVVGFTVAASLPARAEETRDLAGWWVAIDNLFPALWERGDIVAMEELLIVSPDGRVENRSMGFYPLDCVPKQPCSDAPLIATARLALKGGLLSVADRAETRQTVHSKAADPLIRRIVVTGAPAWSATLDGNLLILRAATASVTRAFARIAPARLQRLRAGMMATEQPAARHWRCFFANATGNDPAFAALSSGARAAPAFLDDYLRAASYQATLGTLGSLPTADDPDPRERELAAGKPELVLLESFPGVEPPGRHADALKLRAGARALDDRAAGRPAGEAPVKLAVSDAELAAYARVRRGAASGSTDAEVRRLFCLE